MAPMSADDSTMAICTCSHLSALFCSDQTRAIWGQVYRSIMERVEEPRTCNRARNGPLCFWVTVSYVSERDQGRGGRSAREAEVCLAALGLANGSAVLDIRNRRWGALDYLGRLLEDVRLGGGFGSLDAPPTGEIREKAPMG